MKNQYALLSIVCLTTSGCSVQQMAQTWQLDRLRVLATQSTPAEAAPGETVAFQSLIYQHPDESLEGVVWFGCLNDSATSFGCTIDPELLDGLSAPPTDPNEQFEWFTELQEAGLLGFEPTLPPSWDIPEDALDALDEADKVEGLSAFLNLTVIPTDAEDDEDIEVAFKRYPISLNPEPNQNPLLSHFLVNDTEYSADEIPRITVGGTLELDIAFEDGSVEEYTYTNPDTGVSETRTETPYLSWYSESGTFSSVVSLLPYTNVEWTAPDSPTQSEIIVTVRDRRGGMDWIRFDVIVEAE